VLVKAYRYTGDEKYARHAIAMMLDYIKKCPVEDGRRMERIDNMDGLAARRIGVEGLTTKGHPAMQWTQMAAMRGLQRWPSVLQYCIHSDAMTPDALAKILTSMTERQRYLVDALPFTSPGNHGTRTPTMVLDVAAALPEIKEREKWADAATAELLRRYNWYGPDQKYGFVYRDGATVEICPRVAWGDYGTLLKAIKHIEALGRDVPAQLAEVRNKMIEYLAYCVWPDNFARRSKRPRSLTGLPELSHLDYILSGGTKGTAPKYASYPMRSGDEYYAGTYFMRSGWSDDAVVLRTRFGPTQYKYSQRGLGDVGDIGFWGYGALLIPHLDHHPREGEFRIYGDRSFCGHGRSESTISIDGVGQSRANRIRWADKPLENLWVTTPVFDYLRGAYTFDAKRINATHTRAFLFLKPDYFVVIDRIDSDDRPHEYRMKYQLHHHLTAERDGIKVTGTKNGAPAIVVAPSRSDLKLSIVKGQREPVHEGWHLYAADKAAAAPALIYTWKEIAPSRVETVLWPVKPGDAANVRVDRQVADGLITLTITRGDRVDVITCGEGDNVAFRRTQGGRILAAGVVGSAPLEAEGLSIRPKRPGAAYLKLDGKGGGVASSNCEAAFASDGARIEQVPWDGK